MAVIRRRAKSAVKKRHGKSIKLSKVDKVWKDYVEYAIIKQVLYRSEANIEGHFKVQLIGKPYNNSILTLLEKGFMIGKYGLKPAEKLSRRGYMYGLYFVDNKYKGQIVFDADKDFKKRVHLALKNTNDYYRIEQ